MKKTNFEEDIYIWNVLLKKIECEMDDDNNKRGTTKKN